MWVLKSHLNNPPGNFPYEQTEGIRKKFEATSLINEQAYRVADFRKGNGLPRATFEEALQDVDMYQCQRLGYMPSYCYNTEQSYDQVAPAVRPKAGCCGARV